MNRAYGMPGVGGSLGKCCYCGDTFMAEILLGKTCREVVIGGQAMFVHTRKDCFKKLVALADSGQLSIDRWADLPDGSPLRDAMKKLCEGQSENESMRAKESTE